MSQTAENNKRIAKNTLLLYFRMLFTMIITLYTSRIILKALGIEDFGIYNVVAGIVTFIGFINGTMSTSTSRFITYEMGRNDSSRINIIFNTAFQIHLLIAILILILTETIGLWFVYTHLNIPEDKLADALYIYQFAIISLSFNILTVPYNSLIVANEKMSVYAYITVADVILKLIIAWLIMFVNSNRLVYYGLLLMISQLIQNVIYHIYCRNNNYKESRLRRCFNRDIFKNMLEFAGWSVFTSISAILYTQGLNILLNLFFGPVINASRGIAVQVQGAVSRFCVSVQTAFNPQITKSYASNNLEYERELIVNSSRFSVFLLLFLSISLFTETKFIINLWLSETPSYVCNFIRLMLVTSIFESMCNPLGAAMLATGKIKIYQTSVGILLLLIVPISYVFLKLGFSPTIVFKVHLCITLLTLIVRIVLVNRFIKMTYRFYIQECILFIIKPLVLLFLLLLMYYHFIILPPYANIAIVHSITLMSIFVLGLKANEKHLILQKIKSICYNDTNRISH